MVTSGFNIHPALIRPIALGFALAGCYLLGSGLYDLLIDHDTTELFQRGRTILISKKSDADPFHRLIAYRLIFGVMLGVLAYGLRRLSRWWSAGQ
jgi:hypothetical protein